MKLGILDLGSPDQAKREGQEKAQVKKKILNRLEKSLGNKRRQRF